MEALFDSIILQTAAVIISPNNLAQISFLIRGTQKDFIVMENGNLETCGNLKVLNFVIAVKTYYRLQLQIELIIPILVWASFCVSPEEVLEIFGSFGIAKMSLYNHDS